MRSSGAEHIETDVTRPLKEAAEVLAVHVEGAASIPGQEPDRRQLGLVDLEL